MGDKDERKFVLMPDGIVCDEWFRPYALAGPSRDGLQPVSKPNV